MYRELTRQNDRRFYTNLIVALILTTMVTMVSIMGYNFYNSYTSNTSVEPTTQQLDTTNIPTEFTQLTSAENIEFERYENMVSVPQVVQE